MNYEGPLPKYASKGERARLIRIFCKGKCRSQTWAELNLPYPGQEALKKAPISEYKAVCLKCGKLAFDNYNWPGRP